MEDLNFNRFDDNTFSVTISLAEYRFLVEENARMRYALEMMSAQHDALVESMAEDGAEGEEDVED